MKTNTSISLFSKKNKKAFTLVELIIVITILAILATIGFLSFQDYTKDARDGNRVSTLKNIEKWLKLYELKIWMYPDPEKAVQILSGTTILINQWIIWKNISQSIKLNKEVIDPKDATNYLYAITGNKKKYQLWTYLEEDNFFTTILQTYASEIDYTKRYFYTLWDLVWIVMNEATNTPISIDDYPSGELDITDEDNKLKVYFSNDTLSGSVTGSGSDLTQIIQTNQNTTPTQSTTKSCSGTPHNETKTFWDTLSVLPGNSCPAWVLFTCHNGDWIHETLDKNDYPYASCIVWENMCTLTDGFWWIVLSDTTPSCYLVD